MRDKAHLAVVVARHWVIEIDGANQINRSGNTQLSIHTDLLGPLLKGNRMNKFERIAKLWLAGLLSTILVAGCGGGDSAVPVGAPPTVTAVAPQANSVAVPINIKKITANFSKAMNVTSLNASSFTLSCAGTPVTGGGAVTYLAAGNVATLPLPAATNLPVNTLCTATVTTGAKDTAGVALASAFVWTFTTGAVADTIPPTVALTVPVAGAPAAGTNTLINATFSEDMDPTTITGTTFTLVNTTLGGTAVAGNVSYVVGSRIASFTPTTPATLPASTLFTATISTVAADLAGNALAVSKVWTFTTGAGASTDVIPGVAGSPGASPTNPTVISSIPSNGAINVPTSTNSSTNVVTGRVLTATFNQAMNPATIISPLTTFTLKESLTGTNVPGTVTMNAANTIATFTPTAPALTANMGYTATVTTAARTAGGAAMARNVVWSFTTKATAFTGQAPVNLGLAGNYTIFANTGIANAVTPAAITGDMGVSQAVTSTAITGFALNLPAGSAFSTSAQVTGNVYAFDYAAPTPTNVTTASADMGSAYTDAAGRLLPDFVDLSGGILGGLTLAPGLYRWNSAVTLPFGSNVTLSGGPNDVWILQITGTVTTAANTNVFLTGGALPKNVFWQVAGATVTVGAGAHFEGVVLAQNAMTFGNQASVSGRLLAQTAVNLSQNAITPPAP